MHRFLIYLSLELLVLIVDSLDDVMVLAGMEGGGSSNSGPQGAGRFNSRFDSQKWDGILASEKVSHTFRECVIFKSYLCNLVDLDALNAEGHSYEVYYDLEILKV